MAVMRQRCVLVVGVEHDDDIGASGQSFAVAGLLVASVAVVAVVLKDEEAEAAAEIDGMVGTVIVDQDADVDQARQFIDGDLQSLLRIVGGHDDRDALAVDHFAKKRRELRVVYPNSPRSRPDE